jgi:ribosome-binding protein aMBF1 (putative translation factor)
MSSVVFLPTHADANITAGYACFPVVICHNSVVDRIITPAKVRGVSARDRIAKWEQDPVRAASLAKARQRLGTWVGAEFPQAKWLAALRLKAGLSQATLAARLGTQQSNVSRWEKNPSDMQYSTIKKMAAALNVTTQSICDAIDQSGTTAEKASA